MPLLFSFENDQKCITKLSELTGFSRGDVVLRHFPDGESSVRILSEVKDQDVIIVCSLHQPDTKLLPLLFFVDAAKDLGAKSVGLIAPYLSYLRQDSRFNRGESLTSQVFATLISHSFDWLLTVDPHLHRYKTLDEIYTIPTTVVHTADVIATWIQSHIKNPLLIGPDVESKQWVHALAEKIGAPYVTAKKIRRGDTDVIVDLPDVERYKDCIPVIVDDIISTAHTMIEAVKGLKEKGTQPPVCIGIHALFVGDAFKALRQVSAQSIITCNTIEHESNEIDVCGAIAEALKNAKFI